MKPRLNRLKDFWLLTASKAGGVSRKTLEKLIPEEVLKNSLFIGSFYDVARKVETLTEETGKEGSRKFLLKKGRGQVIDLAVTPATGLPITLWSALITDGCRVAAWTLNTAAKSASEAGSGDELTVSRVLRATAGGIERTGNFSESIFVFFDRPGKAEAEALLDSSRELLDYAKENSAMLGSKVMRDAQELYRLTQGIADKGTIEDRKLQEELIERSSKLIQELCVTAGDMGDELRTFIMTPNKDNFVALALRLQKSFKKAPLFFYREITALLRRFPEYKKHLPRADKEILAMAKIIRRLPKETAGKMAEYMEHYRLNTAKEKK